MKEGDSDGRLREQAHGYLSVLERVRGNTIRITSSSNLFPVCQHADRLAGQTTNAIHYDRQ